jgi:release factor glutamine methyltransferase
MRSPLRSGRVSSLGTMNADGTISWRQLWDECAGEFGRPQARWLCEEASGAFGDEFLDVVLDAATERQVAHLDVMIERVRGGEPLQYVLGHWSFRTLDLMVDRRVLIPRPETEQVAGVAIDAARAMLRDGVDRPLRVADLGTGSGAIGLSLAAELPRSSCEVWLTDLSLDALDVARANAAGLGIAAAGVRFAHGSWFDPLPASLRGRFGVIVSNPPYIAHDDVRVESAVREWEPSGALFALDGGLADVRVLAAHASEWLSPGGTLVLEIGSGQGEATAALLSAAGLVDVRIELDAAGHERIAIGCR